MGVVQTQRNCGLAAAANRPKHDARSLERRMTNKEWRNEKSSLNPACRGPRQMSRCEMQQAGLRALARRYASCPPAAAKFVEDLEDM
jgi:hypothetical protein